MNLTKAMLLYMKPGQWVSNVILSKRFGWRFGGRLYELREKWVKFEKKQGKWYLEYWRLVSIPNNIDYTSKYNIKMKPLIVTEVTGSKVEEKEIKTWFFSWLLGKLWIK